MRELSGKMVIPSSRIRLLDTIGHGNIAIEIFINLSAMSGNYKTICVKDSQVWYSENSDLYSLPPFNQRPSYDNFLIRRIWDCVQGPFAAPSET